MKGTKFLQSVTNNLKKLLRAIKLMFRNCSTKPYLITKVITTCAAFQKKNFKTQEMGAFKYFSKCFIKKLLIC